MIDSQRLLAVVRDSLVQKRVLKWGYARLFGGPGPSACDSVAAHAGAVTTLAVILAHECYKLLLDKTGTALDLGDVALMAIFHDLGEGRSGDTGAAGHGISGTCNLFSLEREGLGATMEGLVLQPKIMKLFDDYRAYRTPEAIAVHIADNIDGFEKGLEVGHGRGEPVRMALSILSENISLYRARNTIIPALGPVCDFFVSQVLRPAILGIAEAYGLDRAPIVKLFDVQVTIAAE